MTEQQKQEIIVINCKFRHILKRMFISLFKFEFYIYSLLFIAELPSKVQNNFETSTFYYKY